MQHEKLKTRTIALDRKTHGLIDRLAIEKGIDVSQSHKRNAFVKERLKKLKLHLETLGRRSALERDKWKSLTISPDTYNELIAMKKESGLSLNTLVFLSVSPLLDTFIDS